MEALGIGVMLGLAAGLAPGPMLALVLSASLQGGFAAGAFVAALGVGSLRAPVVTAAPAPARRDVGRAVLVNLTNPHPWIFWIGAGGPVLLRAADTSAWAAVAFVAGFYGLLVGTKVVLAGGVAAGRRRLLAGRGLRIAVRGAAALLVAAGVLLVLEGVREL